MKSVDPITLFALFCLFRSTLTAPRHHKLRHQRLRHNDQHHLRNAVNVLTSASEAVRDDVTISNKTNQPITAVPRHHLKRHPLLFDWTTSCGVCDPERCEETATSCPSGLIRDACDCCYVCGNLEDTPCDLPSDVFRFGECGEGLICSPVAPEFVGHGTSDSYCACASDVVICGSDGRTYSNPCRFKRASGRTDGLVTSHEGPCLAAPHVEIPPMNQTAESGSSAVFSCSVLGFPLAWFEWLMNGESVFRPNLGNGVLTQVRSGPLPYQVTTWLEIDRVMPSHSGLFTCVARNEHGETRATARLEVVPGEFPSPNYYVYRGKHLDFSNRETSPESRDYLRSHILPPDDVPEVLGQLGRKDHNVQVNDVRDDNVIADDLTDSDQQFFDVQLPNRQLSQDDVVDDDVTSDTIGDALSNALRTIVKPKEFKDIFFDDDEIYEGSGLQ